MKYEVLKDVIIDGSSFPAGSVVDIHHNKTDRLVKLGFIAPKTSSTGNRSVGLTGSSETPRKRGRPRKNPVAPEPEDVSVD